jgi:formylglycine-generating enzyme required for sulfatase activity
MVVKGSDANLKQLATLDLSHPTSADDLIRLGDRWKDFAAKQPDMNRSEIRQHALSFYKVALEAATGLQKTLLERSIADVSTDPTPTGSTFSHSKLDKFTNSIGMRFVRIKPGEFLMGSPVTAPGRAETEVLHNVKITKSFLMATTTVTQAQWKAVMGDNPSHVQGDELPVGSVTWNDALTYCKKLGEKEGKHYRLPTEAEWEYACRAGTQTAYGGSNNPDEVAWYLDNSDGHAHPVGQKKPNAWGPYDMAGNVWQWCSDGYGPYDGDATDPKGGNNTSDRVVRGGCSGTPFYACRAAFRHWAAPGWHADDTGFRVCLDF